MTANVSEPTELIVFDCDGVLLDSEVIADQVILDYCAARFPELDFSGWRQHIGGVANAAILAAMENEHGIAFPADAETVILETLDARLRREVRAVPGVAEVLPGLQPPLAVASNSHSRYLHELLGQVGLLPLFRSVHGADQVERGKPAPDVYLLAARHAAVAPRRCLVVEDSVTGVTAAVAAGMRVIGFTGGSHQHATAADRLRDAGAEAVIDAMSGVTAHIVPPRPAA